MGRGHSCTAAVCVTAGRGWPPGSAAGLPPAAAAFFRRPANVNRFQQWLVLGLSSARLLPPWGRSRIRAERLAGVSDMLPRLRGFCRSPKAAVFGGPGPSSPPQPHVCSGPDEGRISPQLFGPGLSAPPVPAPGSSRGFQGLRVTAATPPRARPPAQLDSVREEGEGRSLTSPGDAA